MNLPIIYYVCCGEVLTIKYSLDVYIPEKNIGIEFCGLYWHSDIYKKPNYHYNKYIFFKEKGIRLLTIFENEWLYKRGIVKGIIEEATGTYSTPPLVLGARDTILKPITNQIYKDFLIGNHLQGYCPAKLKFGLYDKRTGILLSLMSFGKSRYSTEHEYEIIRYCTKSDVKIHGGFKKILSHFEKEFSPKSLISYCDARYFTGQVYSNSGFEFLRHSEPDYFYFKHNDRSTLYHRSMFQKHKLAEILPVFDQNKSEYSNMLDNKYLRIHDCGNLVFGKKYDK